MNYVNDWGVEVVGFQTPLGGLYHNEEAALNMAGMHPVHALVRFADCHGAYEALAKLTGERAVLIALLCEAHATIVTIVPEDSTEAELLGLLIERIEGVLL